MKTEDILKRLCAYDLRNPDHIVSEDELEDNLYEKRLISGCSCDNCFYGRTLLALELLKYISF